MTKKISTKATLVPIWLEQSGLVVNRGKTEFCVFHRNKKMMVCDGKIVSTEKLKVFRILFDSNLDLGHHINYLTSKCEQTNIRFRNLKKYFDKQELITLATSVYYFKLFNGTTA